KYRWVDIGVAEFYKYIGLIFYMAMMKLGHVRDYWRRNNIFSVPFPSLVMSRDRYRTISCNVHLSDPDEDRQNDAKKGTSDHYRLFRIKPLMYTIQNACKALYHPHRCLAVDEPMVPCKGHTGMTQYMRNKPTKWGFKLFVLADSSNGYTVDFSVYTGKNNFPTGQGLCHSKTFQGLEGLSTYCSAINALTKKDGPLLFVKWKDTREVSVCSTIHNAYAGDTVRRKVKSKQGVWITESFPCPSPVTEYNKYMGGVDLSDQLIQYYTTQHKRMKWYRKLFLHFLDISATNAYIIHREIMQQDSMTHKAFMEELTAQLCDVTLNVPTKMSGVHVPVLGAELSTDGRMKATSGRKTCMNCRRHGGNKTKTPWKCAACDVQLCLQPDRNCFEAWHDQDSDPDQEVS
uniref:PiggyBac transposable element-derived protein domain-containing protein n=1 Tax=Paramormyrops kingsleyae TaxID=1676925 RepID=A0A3B3S5R5_9TELE